MSITPAALVLEDAAAYCALSVSTLQKLVREGAAPKPRKLSERRVAFLVKDLDSWLVSLPESDILPPENTGAKKPR